MPETSENAALLNWLDTQDRERLLELEPGTIYATADADGNLNITDTDEYGLGPRSQARAVTVLDPGSFLDYWHQWATDSLQPEAWADPNARTVTGILDAETIDGSVGWASHRVVLKPEKTDDWVQWVDNSGRLMTQEAFAEWIEDHLLQIVEPAGGTMLEIAQSLQGKTGAEWKQSHRLSDGQIGMQYVETATARAGQKGELVIPAEFHLALSPFKGCDPYKIRARFRYRLAPGGEISLGYKLDRATDVEDAAWRDILDQLREGLEQQDVTAQIRTGRP